MSYSQALEQQIRMVEILRGLRYDMSDVVTQETMAAIDGDGSLLAIRACVEHADPVYWAPETCDILEATAPDMPPWTIRREDLVSPFGFCWFAKSLPLPVPDGFGKVAPLVAFSWGTSVDGVLFTCYLPSPREPFGVPALSGVWRFGQTSVEMIDAAEDATYLDDAPNAPADVLKARAVREIQYISAGIAFMNQRIFTAEQIGAGRQARKRASQTLGVAPLIRVVKLRRSTQSGASPGPHEAVEWSHQWIVSGHWRQQYYPSTNEHRPVFILPYVKGPEDKPLKPPRAKVFAVVR